MCRLERYMKHDLTTTARDSIEKDWLKRWTERLGNPDRTPRLVEALDRTSRQPRPHSPPGHAYLR